MQFPYFGEVHDHASSFERGCWDSLYGLGRAGARSTRGHSGIHLSILRRARRKGGAAHSRSISFHRWFPAGLARGNGGMPLVPAFVADCSRGPAARPGRKAPVRRRIFGRPGCKQKLSSLFRSSMCNNRPPRFHRGGLLLFLFASGSPAGSTRQPAILATCPARGDVFRGRCGRGRTPRPPCRQTAAGRIRAG
jgi:hypothetical protein